MRGTDTGSDALLLENQLCFPLYACAKEVVRRYREPLQPLGITYTQYLVMLVLWEHGRMTERRLGRILHLESSTLAPLLTRLEKQGLIDRIVPENNERKLFVDLTDKGRTMREQAEAVPAAMRGCIPLETEELLTLKSLLCKAAACMHGSGLCPDDRPGSEAGINT